MNRIVFVPVMFEKAVFLACLVSLGSSSVDARNGDDCKEIVLKAWDCIDAVVQDSGEVECPWQPCIDEDKLEYIDGECDAGEIIMEHREVDEWELEAIYGEYSANCLEQDWEDEWDEGYHADWEWEEWYDEGWDGEDENWDGLECPPHHLEDSADVIYCLWEDWDDWNEEYTCDNECNTEPFMEKPHCFIETADHFDSNIEEVYEWVQYYDAECRSGWEVTDFDGGDCESGSKEELLNEVLLISGKMHCPDGWGFPTSAEMCKAALVDGARKHEFEDSFLVIEEDKRQQESKPRCFYDGKGEYDEIAGFIEDENVNCEWQPDEKFKGWKGVCIKCGGCFGECTDCGDGFESRTHGDRFDSEDDDYGDNPNSDAGPVWGAVILIAFLLFVLACFGMCIYAFKVVTGKNVVHIEQRPQVANFGHGGRSALARPSFEMTTVAPPRHEPWGEQERQQPGRQVVDMSGGNEVTLGAGPPLGANGGYASVGGGSSDGDMAFAKAKLLN